MPDLPHPSSGPRCQGRRDRTPLRPHSSCAISASGGGRGGTWVQQVSHKQWARATYLPTQLPFQLAQFAWRDRRAERGGGGAGKGPGGSALLCGRTQALWLPGWPLGAAAEVGSIMLTVNPLRFMGHNCQGPFWPRSFMAAWLWFSSQPRTWTPPPCPPQLSESLPPLGPGGHRLVCSPRISFHLPDAGETAPWLQPRSGLGAPGQAQQKRLPAPLRSHAPPGTCEEARMWPCQVLWPLPLAASR